MERAALVVGVGAELGLGASLCRRFAREGLPTFAAGRTAARVEALAATIRAQGDRATGCAADATQRADVAALFDRIEADTGAPPGLVVYNPGNAVLKPFLELDAAAFEKAFRTGALGAFHVAQEAARRMLPAGGGTLLFTGATASVKARPPFTAFAAAKHALRALAHGLAREFGPQGLHVGHVLVDGVIAGDQVLSRMPKLADELGEDGMLSPDAIADVYWHLHTQHRSAWTLELDLRPYRERF